MKIQGKIRDALVEICKVEADKVMKEMWKKTDDPEIRKELNSSKFFISTKQGSNQYQVRAKMSFGFKNNEYSDALEKGSPAKPFSGTCTQKVGEHKRELGKAKTKTQKIAKTIKLKKKRSTTVKKHTRTYKNMKPVKLDSGEWRILSQVPAQQKKEPLYKGISKIMNNDTYLATQLKKFIKL